MGGLYCVKAEQQLLKDCFLVGIYILVTDEQGLGLHYHLNLAQVVAYQCGAGANDVEYGIGQTYAGGNLNGAGDDVCLGLDSLLLKE